MSGDVEARAGRSWPVTQDGRGARIRVLIADDHSLMREGIASVLAREEDMVLVAEAHDGHSAIQKYSEHRPDVTLMDVQMPDISGIAAMRIIRSAVPHARIIMLSAYAGHAQMRSALHQGAVGFLLKTALRKELQAAIRNAHCGKPVMSAAVAQIYTEHLVHEDLTRRESEVLRHTAFGMGNREIAAVLDVSEDTVKAHLKAIFRKLDARDRAHAVFLAMKHGIIMASEWIRSEASSARYPIE